MKKIIRVFPGKTNETPIDDMAFVGEPLFSAMLPEADEVHVSITFIWDKSEGERLAELWSVHYDNVKIGGPAYGDPGGEFKPGMYLRKGRVITTRGCSKKCSYCYVPKREGNLRTLKIKNGWRLLDNNFLAAPVSHRLKVYKMLSKQPLSVGFNGGLDAQYLTQIDLTALSELNISVLFLAYDKINQKDSVEQAIKGLQSIGLNRYKIYVYVLCNYLADDTVYKADERLEWIKSLGATPFAMFYRGDDGKRIVDAEWRRFIRAWSRPALIWSKHHETIKGMI